MSNILPKSSHARKKPPPPHYQYLCCMFAGQASLKKGVCPGVAKATTTMVEKAEDLPPMLGVTEVMRRKADELSLRPDTEMNMISATDMSPFFFL